MRPKQPRYLDRTLDDRMASGWNQLVIEPEVSPHTRLDRQERDAFIDGALAAAGLPILHLRAQRAYVPAELRARIEGRVISADGQAVREGMWVRPRPATRPPVAARSHVW